MKFLYETAPGSVMELPMDVGQAMKVVQKMQNRGHALGQVTLTDTSHSFSFENRGLSWPEFHGWMGNVLEEEGLGAFDDDEQNLREEWMREVNYRIQVVSRMRRVRMPLINVDVDGVMADFDAGFPLIFGVHHDTITEDEKWAMVRGHENFFGALPKMPHAQDLLHALRHTSYHFVTGCPKSNYIPTAIQKRGWLNASLTMRPDTMIIPVPGGSTKCVMMHAPLDVLIDDHTKNCAAWVEAGGIAIKHNNVTETLTKLHQHLGTLIEGEEQHARIL